MLQDVWTTGTSKRALQSPSLRGPAVVPAASAGAPEAQRQYFGPEQTFAVVCSETPNPGPTAFRVLDGFAFERSGPIGQVWSWGTEVCSTWPATAADAYTGPWNARTANPVLVVGMTLDPATNYRGSVVMNRLLPRSRLLTVDGYGHGTFSNPSACANRYISPLPHPEEAAAKRGEVQAGRGTVRGQPVTRLGFAPESAAVRHHTHRSHQELGPRTRRAQRRSDSHADQAMERLLGIS
jgi:hypothetical protein